MDTELIAHKTQVRRLSRGEFYPASIELVGEDSPSVFIEGTVEQLRKLATDILMSLSTDKELESYHPSLPIAADSISAGGLSPLTTPRRTETKTEGEIGTWSHCGSRTPHPSHLHTIVFNEGLYPAILCLGAPLEENT